MKNRIKLFDGNETDFRYNGKGVFIPVSAEVEGITNGAYTLTVVVPMDARGKWERIKPGDWIECLSPIERIPVADESELVDGHATVMRDVFANRSVYKYPSPSSATIPTVGELTRADEWFYFGRMIKVRDSVGNVGYISSTTTPIRSEATVIDADEFYTTSASGYKNQLFRIYSTAPDSEAMTVTLTCPHAFYDLEADKNNDRRVGYVRSMVSVADYSVNASFRRENNPFVLKTKDAFPTYIQLNPPADYTYDDKNIVEILLGEHGIVNTTDGGSSFYKGNSHIVRDNFDIYVINDAEPTALTDIRRGKNCNGVRANADYSEYYNRIVPIGVGMRTNGSDLMLDEVYVDAENDNYPVKKVYLHEWAPDKSVYKDYDLETRKTFLRLWTREMFRSNYGHPAVTLLNVLYTMAINYAAVDDPNIVETAHRSIGHFVRVHDTVIGLDAVTTMARYVWDATTGLYTTVELGELLDFYGKKRR